MVAVHHHDGNEHVAGDKKGCETGEEAEQYEDASEEFGECGDVTQPVGHAQGRNEMAVTIKGREGVAVKTGGNDFAVAVVDHGAAEHKAQKESAPRLQVVQ